MLIKEKEIKGVFEIELEPQKDRRGFFMRTYDEKVFKKYGLQRKWVQENHSYSKKKGTIRGLHFQFPPYSETKLIRVVQGKVFKVFVDLRKKSSTFGEWEGIILSADNKKMLYVPRGFALGMCSLTNRCVVLYKMDNYHNPESQGIIKWNDLDLDIDWPLNRNHIISERDTAAKSFKEFIKTYGSISL
ncbi:MAG: dTDP-4-dehydrorhamnose 3,5-epimerase [Candidatus Omnitrophica bacterium]|nr:dTDP-4-dehydrorhamnose 3,5-epimerase [Candidatus Omnitrophota bacterium]MDD5353335.1 dTDP-4-dehydrorhamnose 3,5-epimerase [Candidatus Omnitrophota bacterium]MDD5591873.1 dTDP-4-dehydrorhamnose 3,5-epimerase [Candidatus Omnitrophota bacterium]